VSPCDLAIMDGERSENPRQRAEAQAFTHQSDRR
jgi:hypothetical protein